MNNNSAISIITVFSTVYNIEVYLPRFFECMASQTYREYILLVIDDGSEDNSLDVCKSFAECDSRIRIVSCDHMGIAAARNLAISMIDTPFAASADGDDVYEPDYLKHLIEAQAKYKADLVISRVIYRNEKYERIGGFLPRNGEIIEKEEFPYALPCLLDEGRLNYLYAKLYRTEYLKCCQVENNVEHGSDTMINSQYVSLINSIVLIDDEDANYIRYNTRSVTSYRGHNLFNRLIRIEQFSRDTYKKAGLLSGEMQYILDKRVFRTVNWSLDVLSQTDLPADMVVDVVTQICENRLYLDAFERKITNHFEFNVRVIPPDKVMAEYITKKTAFIRKKEASTQRELERTKKDLQAMQDAIWALEHSISFRIGRILTFPGRKIRDSIKILLK